MLNIVWIAFGGALGSVCRFAISYLFPWDGNGFPTATFVTNLIASLLLGILAGLLLSKFSEVPGFKAFAIVGFCGGFSTFSTFAFELFKLNQNGNVTLLLMYALGSVLLSFILLYLGFSLTSNLN